MQNPMQHAIDRLSTQTVLTTDEENALLRIGGRAQSVAIGVEFVKRDQVVSSVCLIVEGMVARTIVATDGSRQITAFYVAGDIPDLHSVMQPRVPSSLMAVTACEILRIPHDALCDVMAGCPGLMEAFWRYTVWDASVAAEWVANVGARAGPQRVAHLLCELAVRSGEHIDGSCTYRLPVTQSVLAKATGLSTVHVNRSLHNLRTADLLQFTKSQVSIPDWHKLTEAADFNDSYLQPEKPLRLH